ncbi:NtaA/DmoA family FMN-dependent monooxygenase [Streptomyces anulatus]|uniref:NtaA/DmoA family FMN-dependent monooxygenase n=1 Tax=Streptomyces TaxID=1883 RepID=UPI000241A086|nr:MULTISPECIES: NtaA/DmoA family FMN-dependent monooxygenase [Streptomyces]EHM28060.1 putative FMNH2-utilizing oxygenase [Streptomyces sp. W007]WSI79027.1 NtaA/DmoA family FMN-dependent monooxygenase [Streptomyces anulatus]WTD11347.1 NtaA/DmoA family FMN-dependent monooxygenase [Streptomyces anulatus]WTE04656.1 NtaA/DmoA family FMN-dependent monooxygenase [Streptomyces anulatus]
MRQIHLAAQLPGIHNVTVWSDPRSESQIAIDSFVRLARTVERGKFDFFFLAEGLRLREHKGQVYDLDIAGRPENLTVLSALAAVTTHLGLAATVNATYNEPYEVARRFATLDHLSGGRAAWNVVTSHDAFTGENFRRGGFLPEADRYSRAAEFLSVARVLWDSWAADDLRADAASGVFARAGAGRFAHRGRHFDIAGRFTTPPGPQGHPVVIQSGESDVGREFAASEAEVVFSKHNRLDTARDFYRDVKRRLAAYGRSPDDLLILPTANAVVADTDAEAAAYADEIARDLVSPQTAIAHLEAVWGRDLSAYDPDGPLPGIEPQDDAHFLKGHSVFRRDRAATARQWRRLAAERSLSIRELVIEVGGRPTFVGSPRTVADAIDHFVQTEGADGFVLVPHLIPGGLDDVVDRVVPLLQEKGSFRADYTGTTLRNHLRPHSGTTRRAVNEQKESPA